MNLKQYNREVAEATAEFNDRCRLASDDFNARMDAAMNGFFGNTPENPPAAPETAAEPAESKPDSWFAE